MSVKLVTRIALLGAALLVGVAFAPGLAAAQDGVMYEVSETMVVKGGKMARRVANAALVGWVNGGTPLCPSTMGKCHIVAFAQDNIDLATGKGPVNGSFAIVVQDANTVDGAEAVVFQGSLVGQMDLSPALLNSVPVGTISGTWTARGRLTLDGIDRSGTFTGVFRLPFSDPATGAPSYLMAPGTIVPVADAERSLNTPLVRLDLKLQ
jgi:hypothetical protein